MKIMTFILASAMYITSHELLLRVFYVAVSFLFSFFLGLNFPLGYLGYLCLFIVSVESINTIVYPKIMRKEINDYAKELFDSIF
jgi:hypothetical protein